MTETYRDRFEWMFSSVLLAAVYGFRHLLSSIQKHVGHHLTAQQAIH